MEVNFFGTLNVTRAVRPVMRARRRGHVVTVSALLGIVGAPFVSIFSASKFALEGFNGHEPGDRKKLASAFVSIVDMKQPPKRWVAGEDAVEGISAKGSQLIANANAFRELSTGLAHDD